MKRFALLFCALVAACGDDAPNSQLPDATPLPGVDPPPIDEAKQCSADAEAFASQAMLAILGRRPYSQDEVELYADLVRGADAAGRGTDGRAVAAQAMMDDPAFVDRWQEHFMDALRVARIDDQEMSGCYNRAYRDVDDAELATFVRDKGPQEGTADDGQFSMRDLIRSSLVLDDISPAYRAHLFVLVAHPIPAANVDAERAELARRDDFGGVFDSAYLNRDIVCLGCHNSEASVTDRNDPVFDRHWAMPGHFEKAIWGDSQGAPVDGAHAMFRFDGFLVDEETGVRPWGWTRYCGSFDPTFQSEVGFVQGNFAGLTGDQLTTFDLERALARGFESLRKQGLVVDGDLNVTDPEQAFAYLVSAAIVEGVWREVVGTPLTIANYFPRTEVARDVLHDLTERFIASGFSVRALLVAIVTSDYFNRLPPEAACESQAYAYPRLWDPWVDSEGDIAMRRNSVGDAVQPVSARALLRAAYSALGWRYPSNHAFPSAGDFCTNQDCETLDYYCKEYSACCELWDEQCVQMLPPVQARDEQQFQRGIGAFLKNGERGFRGLDFQARLVWEDRFGQCAKPSAADDAVDRLVALAIERGATLEDLAIALKDRLINEAFLSEAGTSATGMSERALIETLYGEQLATPVRAEHITATRRLCGVLLSTPQFLLGGMPPRRAETPHSLLLPETGYDAVCQTVVMRGLAGGYAATCADHDVIVTRP